jgi:hypothetical protein
VWPLALATAAPLVAHSHVASTPGIASELRCRPCCAVLRVQSRTAGLLAVHQTRLVGSRKASVLALSMLAEPNSKHGSRCMLPASSSRSQGQHLGSPHPPPAAGDEGLRPCCFRDRSSGRLTVVGKIGRRWFVRGRARSGERITLKIPDVGARSSK